MLAATGTLAGDAVSCLFSLIAIKLETGKTGYRIRSLTSPGIYLRLLLAMACPLMANRICMSFLHSLETVLIPGRLQASGLNPSEALSIYGILTGMAMPLIFFPSALTNSVSVMLLPDVARNQAAGNYRSIAATISQTIRFCLILGIFSFGIFFFLGGSMGKVLFHTDAAGNFLRVLAFLCPFLYLDSTLSSILTGIGKTRQVFLQNLLGHGIRIAFVLLAIPPLGIPGYLYGILASEILTAALRLTTLYRSFPFSFRPFSSIVLPSAAMLVARGCVLLLDSLIDDRNLSEFLLLFLKSATALSVYLLLLAPLFPKRLLLRPQKNRQTHQS